jgi:hypothetical protein
MSRLASKRYLKLMLELLVARRAAWPGGLSDEEESRWVELLDEQWTGMSEKERESVEALLRKKENQHGQGK